MVRNDPMSNKSKLRTRPKPLFHVGQRVTFTLVQEMIHGVVSEDRGPLAEQGKRLYQVQADFGLDEPRVFELVEEDLTPDATVAARKA